MQGAWIMAQSWVLKKCFEQQWEYSMLLPPLQKRTLNWALGGRPLKSPLPLLDNMMVMAMILTTTMIIYISWWSVRLFVCEWWKMITFSRGVVGSPREWRKMITFSRRSVGPPGVSKNDHYLKKESRIPMWVTKKKEHFHNLDILKISWVPLEVTRRKVRKPPNVFAQTSFRQAAQA